METVKKPSLTQQMEDVVNNSAQVEITATNAQDVKVSASVNKELGNGWGVAAVARWFKKKGYEVGALLKWSGK